MNIETVNELITSLESAGELSIKERKYLELAKEFRICSASLDAAIKTGNVLADQNAQLAAENVALKAEQVRIFNSGYLRGHESTVEGYYVDIHQDDITTYHEDIVAEISEEQTPATDRIVAGIKANGVEEFAKYCDESIGFVEPEDEELYTLMEEQARDFAKQLREGADK
ncbi:hypothetical protein AB3X30_05700 [Raoultella terrigena]|uniref:hypothetical protein n=1 Tax=Raoultella terrigena TaxID=577 RepID=UPI00349F7BC5